MKQKRISAIVWVGLLGRMLFLTGWGIAAEVSGPQSGVWRIDGSPYIVTGDVVVPANATLKIDPGVIVKFNGYYRILVQGSLIAEGVMGKRIIFTSIHDKEFGVGGPTTPNLPGNQDWVGIEFAASSQTMSRLEYAIIRYSDRVIIAGSASPTLRQIIIADCQAESIIVDGRRIEITEGNELNYAPPIQAANEAPAAPATLPTTPFSEMGPIKAQPAPQFEAEEFTFGEMVVVSAAKQEQKLKESPANITVITADEIKKMGYSDFVELLRDVMGIDINDPGQGQLDVGMRGVNDRMSMGKHFQMLLDGHDMGWKQFYRNHISTAWISLDAIDRIEIVRGPSSALWGANAFLGTINIITKSPLQNEGNEASFMRGSFDSYQGNLQIRKKFEKNGGLAFFTTLHRDNLPRKVKEWSDIAGSDVILNSNDRTNSNIYFNFTYNDFSFIGHLSRADAFQSISSFSVGADLTRFVMDKKYFIVNWQHNFESNLMIKISGYLDYYNWGKGAQYENNPFAGAMTDPATAATGHFVRQMDGRDNVMGIQGQINFRPAQRISFVLGVDYEGNDVIRWYYPEVWDADKLPVPKFKTDIKATYFQGEVNPFDWLKFTAGLRYDVHSVFKDVLNERLAVVLTPLRNLYVKGLFGTAFKAPSIHELYYFRKNAYYGNPNIKPETNQTLELQIGYALGNILEVSASAFSIDIDDIIAYQKRLKTQPLIGAEAFPESQRPDGTKDYNQQANVGQWKSQGVEGEFKLNLSKQFLCYGDVTYRKAEDAITSSRLYYTADKQGRAGIRYFAANRVYVTLQGRFTGTRVLPVLKFNEPGAPWQVTSDPTTTAPAYVTFDFAAFYPNFVKGLDVTLRLVNLLDNDLYDAGREVLFSLPSRGGFLKFSYHF
ncbi:MAG: TonB-dependent receptor [candidate division KSB1 bacterium]|nr:TonB-dependent receptor [candidate division KSB1 bacterium]MDZ7333549.1 TonB-dependent receptor [candidate division KSB1 bacterium]MDZ7398663.1 TonB-dependent receptor [candidate division KSB1 bacterium]